MDLDFHRRVALGSLGFMGLLTWMAYSTTISGFIVDLPGGVIWGFLLDFVRVGAVMIYTVLITYLVLGGTSQQVQYLVPVLIFVGLTVFLIMSVP